MLSPPPVPRQRGVDPVGLDGLDGLDERLEPQPVIASIMKRASSLSPGVPE
jgi:hypothetical protein